VWNVSATNAGGTGTITVELIMPEPAGLTLAGLAAVGLVAFALCRKTGSVEVLD
jgi:hypothetical protein